MSRTMKWKITELALGLGILGVVVLSVAGNEPLASEPAETATASHDHSSGRPHDWNVQPAMNLRVHKSHGDWVETGHNLEVGPDDVVSGDAVAIGGNLNVRGTVKGEVVSVGGNVHLFKGAHVEHDATAVGGRVIRDEGAYLGGNSSTVNIPMVSGLVKGILESGVVDESRMNREVRNAVRDAQRQAKNHGSEDESKDEAGQEGGDWTGTGRDINVPAGTTVHGEVKVTDGSARIDGDVENGVSTVKGDVTVSGHVGGDVRTLRGSVDVIDGGHVEGDIKTLSGSVTVDGHVDGDIKAVGGDVTLGPKAHVSGDVHVVGGKLVRDPSAVIEGSVVQKKMEAWRYFLDSVPFGAARHMFPWVVFAAIGKLIGWLALALLIGLLFGKHLDAATRYVVERPLGSVGMGLLGWVGLPIGIVALVITCVGILVVPFWTLGFFLSLFLGIFVSAYWLGSMLFPKASREDEHPYRVLLVGTLIVTLVGFVPLIGFFLKWFGLGTLGLGALLLSRFGRRPYSGTGSPIPTASGPVASSPETSPPSPT